MEISILSLPLFMLRSERKDAGVNPDWPRDQLCSSTEIFFTLDLVIGNKSQSSFDWSSTDGCPMLSFDHVTCEEGGNAQVCKYPSRNFQRAVRRKRVFVCVCVFPSIQGRGAVDTHSSRLCVVDLQLETTPTKFSCAERRFHPALDFRLGPCEGCWLTPLVFIYLSIYCTP